MQVRDVRLDKVDLMQDQLEKLIITTDEDKRAWKKREEELLQILQAKDSDMQKLSFTYQDTDFNRLEGLRKDHVIENMQTTFAMVLQRAVQKIRRSLELPKTSNIPTARMEICLDELLRTFQVEIDTLQACFSTNQNTLK